MNTISVVNGQTLAVPVPADAPEGTATLAVVGVGVSTSVVAKGGVATFAPSDTKQWMPGKHVAQWLFVATNGDVSYADAGYFDVRWPATSDPSALGDHETAAERIVAALEGLVEATAADASLSISVAGYSASFANRADVARELGRWRKVVARERGAA